MKKTKDYYTEEARDIDMSCPSIVGEVEIAKKNKDADISNWAEASAERIIEGLLRENGETLIDTDMPDLWERLEKAMWALVSNTSDPLPDDENRPTRGGRYDHLGCALCDYNTTISAASEVINVTVEMERRNEYMNELYEHTHEAVKIMTERIKEAVAKLEEEATLEFTPDEKRVAMWYLEMKEAFEEAAEAAEEANARANDAMNEYHDKAAEFNRYLDDLSRADEETIDPDDAECWLPDTYTADDLSTTVHELHDALYAWKEAHEEATKVEEAQNVAQEEFDDAYTELVNWVTKAHHDHGGYATVSERLTALLDAAREGAF